MRYLLSLLSISPVIAHAVCAPGVNYGSAHLNSPNPICYTYSNSELGGCYAYCGGGPSGAACVEFPNAQPPSRGPYFSNGVSCTPSTSNGPWQDPGPKPEDPNPPVGSDGTSTGGDGVVNIGSMWVGPNTHADLGKGFSVVANNVRVHSKKITDAVKEVDYTLGRIFDYTRPLLNDIRSSSLHNANSTANISNAIEQTFGESNFYLKQLVEKRTLDETFWNVKEDRLLAALKELKGKPSDNPGSGGDGTTASDWQTLRQQLDSLDSWQRIHANNLGQIQMYTSGSSFAASQIQNILESSNLRNGLPSMDGTNELLKEISGKLDNVGGDGQGGGQGDKPCKGPLCTFTPPSGTGHGSALSTVFDESSIADIKGKVADKNKAINDKLQEIKSVFKQSDITISGTYDNDYQNIMGAKVDLSGKSNWELFFNSGPRAALWLLAILIAFGILLGGRKNA
ncbi:hypothetical protein JFQ84_002120 [Aeromonas hydrophila]|nr:hypothetical protein [Aeromonas hydrophila]